MRGYYGYGVQPVTPMVKRLMIINVSIWATLIMILQGWILDQPLIYRWFGLVPMNVIPDFWIWQPFTYMFLHSSNIFHILFNMLMLWWVGSELEMLWGRKFFLGYYLGCGVGAAVLYLVAMGIYTLFAGPSLILSSPVVGASGAIFGLLLAYGILFGERMVLFFMLFPMKAKYFVMILGAIEFFNLIGQGFASDVSNLAHLGGLVSGYLILKLFPKIRDYLLRRRTETRGRRLKLVVDNEATKGPKYWN